ncbi:MAG TPA: phosphotransferase, partial [Polyangiales bacterium]|nr:phosphotransferase [Polyangiales bacterium]
MQGLVEDLRAQLGELRETHISWVFLGETRVLKVKKPVDFGFLDFRTLAARKVACDAELLLNRRLAPDVYLQVLPIHRDATGVHRIGGTGELVDWAVEMQRLPDEDGCDRRLAAGRLTRAQLVAVGERLAHFHAQARSDANTERFGAPETILGNVRENFEQTQDSAPMHLSSAQLKDLQSYQLRFLEAQRERLERRVAMHRVRDGHGDLRLEHVYIGDDGVIRVIDCIEFNERFRYADVCADLAFLTMDLRWHERADLAETLLAAYARESNDFDLYRLVDFYESYRAYVRAKVESFVERDASASQATRERAAAQARKHYLLALASARPALQVPFLCAVGGLIASGKSTLAEQLGAELCVPIVDADRTRKHLAHVQPTERLETAQF